MTGTRTERFTPSVFANAVYVLHAFQKKSPRGIKTRQSDIALVRERLEAAQRDYEEKHS